MEENNWKDCKLKKFLVESGTTNGSQLRNAGKKGYFCIDESFKNARQ